MTSPQIPDDEVQHLSDEQEAERLFGGQEVDSLFEDQQVRSVLAGPELEKLLGERARLQRLGRIRQLVESEDLSSNLKAPPGCTKVDVRLPFDPRSFLVLRPRGIHRPNEIFATDCVEPLSRSARSPIEVHQFPTFAGFYRGVYALKPWLTESTDRERRLRTDARPAFTAIGRESYLGR